MIELTRRDFLVLAASAAVACSLPALPRTGVEPAPAVDEELPISGLAGECSGRYA